MKKIICLFLTLLISCSFVGCGSNDNTQSEPSITAVTPYQGEYVYLTNDLMTEWLSDYYYTSSSEVAVQEKLEELYYPKESITLSWEDTADCDYYVLLFDTKENLSTAQMFQTTQVKKEFANLYVNTDYFWRVVGYKNGEKVTVSDLFNFTTVSTPRTIYVDGLSNTRDIGGYMTVFGKKVKQGLIYRCAKTEGTTDLGRQQIKDVYGIKTEIDLRAAVPHYLTWDGFYSSGEEKAVETCRINGSWLGDSVVYKDFWCPYYANGDAMGLNDTFVNEWHTEEQKHINDKQLVTILKEFANVDNYPIIFHCSAGRDRTGTLACMINALLGVADEDLHIDYETSFFAKDATLDYPYVPSFITTFESIIGYLQSFEGENLAEKTANYLMTYGMTQAEIDTIREIMLED